MTIWTIAQEIEWLWLIGWMDGLRSKACLGLDDINNNTKIHITSPLWEKITDCR